ncbi:hypothetical protein V6N13_059114 [Hibiscus sabdariffa]
MKCSDHRRSYWLKRDRLVLGFSEDVVEEEFRGSWFWFDEDGECLGLGRSVAGGVLREVWEALKPIWRLGMGVKVIQFREESELDS